MFRNNPNGAGIGFIDKKNNKLAIMKGIFSVEELYEKYKFAKENSDNTIIIHCRLATHGEVNAEMCHPFFVNEHLLFAHNGIILDMPASKTLSDTYYFNELVLKDLKEGFETNQYMLDMLDKYLGCNKLAFLNDNGDIAYTNAEGWIDYKGVLYSNETFLNDDEYLNNLGKFIPKCTQCGVYIIDGVIWQNENEEEICEDCMIYNQAKAKGLTND